MGFRVGYSDHRTEREIKTGQQNAIQRESIALKMTLGLGENHTEKNTRMEVRSSNRGGHWLKMTSHQSRSQ